MDIYYNYISDKLNLDIKNSEFYEDERGISPPNFYYEGIVHSFEKNPIYEWNTHSIFVNRGNHIVEYKEDTFNDLLLENEDGSTSWFDGRDYIVIDIDESKVVDVRPANQYYIEDYDFEKSIKRKYKVILEETLEISESDYANFKNTVLNK